MKSARLKYLGLVAVIAVSATISACAQSAPRNEPTPTPVPQPTPTPTALPTATPAPPTPTPEPTATPAPTATPQASPTVQPTPAGSPTAIPVNNVQTYTLSLQIEGITDESEVYGDSIVLRGQTTADAIVSINGVIVPVDETGVFEVPLVLEEGPNQIVVVASDLDGNEVSATFLVVSLQDEQV